MFVHFKYPYSLLSMITINQFGAPGQETIPATEKVGSNTVQTKVDDLL